MLGQFLISSCFHHEELARHVNIVFDSESDCDLLWCYSSCFHHEELARHVNIVFDSEI